MITATITHNDKPVQVEVTDAILYAHGGCRFAVVRTLDRAPIFEVWDGRHFDFSHTRLVVPSALQNVTVTIEQDEMIEVEA